MDLHYRQILADSTEIYSGVVELGEEYGFRAEETREGYEVGLRPLEDIATVRVEPRYFEAETTVYVEELDDLMEKPEESLEETAEKAQVI